MRGKREQSDKQTHRQSLAQQPQPSGPGGTEGQTPHPHIPTAAGCPRAAPPQHTHTHSHTHTPSCVQPAGRRVTLTWNPSGPPQLSAFALC